MEQRLHMLVGEKRLSSNSPYVVKFGRYPSAPINDPGRCARLATCESEAQLNFRTSLWIAIIASPLTGIGSALIFISAVKKDYLCAIKKPRATHGQPNRFSVGKPEDFPSGAIPIEKR
jgi:hypothetical protein